MQDEVNTKVVAIMIKGGKISAEVLKKALDKFVQEIEKAQKQMQQPKTYRGKQSMNNTATNTATCPTVRKQIGKTTYIVRVHFSETAKETMEDKIKRLLREEVRKM